MMKIIKITELQKQLRRLIFNGNGAVRTFWLLSATLIAFSAASLGLRLSANALFDKIFDIWGVNIQTVMRAPEWARTIYVWHGSMVTVIVSLLMIAVALLLRRMWLKNRLSTGKISWGAILLLAGVCFAIFSIALFLLFDSTRLERPLNQPEFAISQPILLIIMLISAVSEEIFNKTVVLDGIKSRWGYFAAVVISVAIFFCDSAGYGGNICCAINVILLGCLCACLYMRLGVWASAGLRCGFSFGTSILMGFGSGQTESVYQVYHVSDGWLTGGTGGMIYGFYMTLCLSFALIFLNQNAIRAALSWLAAKLCDGKRADRRM